MKRTRERLAQADLVLYLLDGSLPMDAADRQALREMSGRRGLAVINKADLPRTLGETEVQAATSFPVLSVSALTGQGIEALKEAMIAQALGGSLRLSGEMVTLARHHRHLEGCLGCLARARELLAVYLLPQSPQALPWELVGLELQEAIRELGEITGQEMGDEVLERIFGEFCLGK
jgi:tRNA modification GTPase